MSASIEAVAALLTACEKASADELMALGRALDTLVWCEDTQAGASLFLALLRVPLATYVERVAPDVELDDVLAIFSEVRGGR